MTIANIEKGAKELHEEMPFSGIYDNNARRGELVKSIKIYGKFKEERYALLNWLIERMDKGYSYEDCCTILGLTPARLSSFLRGKLIPQLRILLRMQAETKLDFSAMNSKAKMPDWKEGKEPECISRLKHWMHINGISRRRLANKLVVREATVSALLTGDKYPNENLALAIHRISGIDISSIVVFSKSNPDIKKHYFQCPLCRQGISRLQLMKIQKSVHDD